MWAEMVRMGPDGWPDLNSTLVLRNYNLIHLKVSRGWKTHIDAIRAKVQNQIIFMPLPPHTWFKEQILPVRVTTNNVLNCLLNSVAS
jgi:hypothetical protein